MRSLPLLASLLLGVGCAAAPLGAQARALARPIQFHNPDWSPDGAELIFESTLRGVSGIFSIRMDGSGLRRLTSDTIPAFQARWSPDGERVVYSSGANGRSDVVLASPTGRSAERLTDGGPGERYFASFSPDGGLIAFQMTPTRGAVRSSVIVIRTDGSGARVVSDTAFSAEAPAWLASARRLAFRQVAYPRARWSEMIPAEARAAQAAAQWVSVTLDDASSARIALTIPQDPLGTFMDSSRSEGARLSRDGRFVAYIKSVSGWAGVFVYDVQRRSERLVIGGPGAGPLGYLRIATLVPSVDTIETFTSSRETGASLRRSGTTYVRSLRRVGVDAWELSDNWLDSTGAPSTTQVSRTAPATLAIERETVRSRLDSASLLVGADRATGWVVPEGQQPRLSDVAAPPPLYARPMVVAAIARSRPSVGAVFEAPSHALAGLEGITDDIDSIRVVRRDSLPHRGGHAVVLVMQHASGQESWVEEVSGRTLVSRGAAGPSRWWWHVARGYTLPSSR